MVNFEDCTDWYYFVKGEIYFSKRNNTKKTFEAEVIFAKKGDLFICVKNRYDQNHSSFAFITRKGFIDYVQSLYNEIPNLYCLAGIKFAPPQWSYKVNENSPIKLIKNRWE